MKRRQVLAGTAGALSVTLAGCADARAVLTMDAVSDGDIASRTSVSWPGSSEKRGLVRRAVENSSATATGAFPPIDVDGPVAFEGAYYELSRSRRRVGDVVRFEIELDRAPDAPDDGTVAFEALPQVDRAFLDDIVPPPPDRDLPLGKGTIYDENEVEASALVRDQEFRAVSRAGDRYSVDVLDYESVAGYEYAYEASLLAGDETALADWARSEYQFELSGLPESEREIVDEAIDGGYYDGSVSDDFSSLAERFRAHDAVYPSDWGGEFLVRYDGTDYWADLQHPPSDAG